MKKILTLFFIFFAFETYAIEKKTTFTVEAFNEAKKNGDGPKRSIVFLHVTGEEKGLLGSKYYTDEDPIYPLNNTVVNLNIDMIGRIDPTREAKNRDYIYLIGTDHDSQDLHDLSEKTNLESVNIHLTIDLMIKTIQTDFIIEAIIIILQKKEFPQYFILAEYTKTTTNTQIQQKSWCRKK
mgnify:CR=1 FL=1